MNRIEIFILLFAILAFFGTVLSSLECSGSFTTKKGASGICNITFGSSFDIPDKRDQLLDSCGPSAPTYLHCKTSLLGLTVTWQAPNDASAASLSGFKLDILEVMSSGKICYVRCPKRAYVPLNEFMVKCHWGSPSRQKSLDMVLSSLPINLEHGCNSDCFSCSASNRRIKGPNGCSKFTSIVQEYRRLNETTHTVIAPSIHLPNKNDDSSFVKTMSYSTSIATTTNAPEPSVNKDAYKFSKSMDYLIAVVIAFLVVSGALGTALVYKFRKESRNSCQGCKKQNEKDTREDNLTSGAELKPNNDQTTCDKEKEQQSQKENDSQVKFSEMQNKSNTLSTKDKTSFSIDFHTRLHDSSVCRGGHLPSKEYAYTSSFRDSGIGIQSSLQYSDHLVTNATHSSLVTNSGHSNYTKSSWNRCPVHSEIIKADDSKMNTADDMTDIEQKMMEINEIYLPPMKIKAPS